MEIQQGRLFWLTGLPATGKTTIAVELFNLIKEKYPNTVHLDGDNMRTAWGIWSETSPEGRRKMSMSYSKMCHILTSQGINVIMSTVALFHDVQAHNREKNQKYYEVLIECNNDILDVRHGEETSDKPDKSRWVSPHHEFPENPELVLQNDTDEHVKENALKITEFSDLEI
jgi:adenylylsulfate kinase-like enzyme